MNRRVIAQKKEHGMDGIWNPKNWRPDDCILRNVVFFKLSTFKAVTSKMRKLKPHPSGFVTIEERGVGNHLIGESWRLLWKRLANHL